MTREELINFGERFLKMSEPKGIAYEFMEEALKLFKQEESVLDKIKAEIESMRIVYDKSPYYEDDRTDEEKAVDWFNMDKLLFLQIIDEYKAGE